MKLSHLKFKLSSSLILGRDILTETLIQVLIVLLLQ